jgi:hypothetical protein
VFGPRRSCSGPRSTRATLWKGTLLAPRDRALLLDWWATALDRDAQTRPFDPALAGVPADRERMDRELRDDPPNGVANYWQVVAPRAAPAISTAPGARRLPPGCAPR